MNSALPATVMPSSDGSSSDGAATEAPASELVATPRQRKKPGPKPGSKRTRRSAVPSRRADEGAAAVAPKHDVNAAFQSLVDAVTERTFDLVLERLRDALK